MIQFTLKCDQDHRFDSWFKSAAAFDALAQAGHISCAICGSSQVTKGMMAPRVSTGKSQGNLAPETQEDAPMPVLSEPDGEIEKAVKALRKKVEATSDYVGADFVKEARAMHAGEVPERSIYGEARLDQAKELAEEGVQVMPLPFRPKRSTQ
ncbi:hypothetical protein SAMN04488040_1431 [Sulfitobacter marinus]|uniref:DUF1178 domain-containing protein n=1 Tax=Sulfitobacter marinus TaxID=394264 RepID=A0A1I6RRN6_9RHOB|nr:DUF1178 family protein [Sulfitobacter marinus]SFS67355.1 hypothetical protein SAMN04488040_1431 [Sulfitobacter marinus]